jgi:hypothetical protein
VDLDINGYPKAWSLSHQGIHRIKSFALTPDKRQRIMNLLQMTGGASYHQTVSSYPLAAIIFLFSLASAASLQLGLYKLLLFAISHRAPSGADVETPNLVIKGNLK